MGNYDSWATRSDYDEYDEPWEPPYVSVTCVQCHRPFEVRADERPPYRCDDCGHHNAELAQRAQDRKDGV